MPTASQVLTAVGAPLPRFRIRLAIQDNGMILCQVETPIFLTSESPFDNNAVPAAISSRNGIYSKNRE